MVTLGCALEQGADHGRELFVEGDTIAVPAAGVGKSHDGALPGGLRDRLGDEGFDGTEQGSDHGGLRVHDGGGEAGDAVAEGVATSGRREIVNGFGGEVDEVAAGGLEASEEVGVVDRRVDRGEEVADGAVESGIFLIEEAAGGGGGLTDEEKADGGWAVVAAEEFAFRHRAS